MVVVFSKKKKKKKSKKKSLLLPCQYHVEVVSVFVHHLLLSLGYFLVCLDNAS